MKADEAMVESAARILSRAFGTLPYDSYSEEAKDEIREAAREVLALRDDKLNSAKEE